MKNSMYITRVRFLSGKVQVFVTWSDIENHVFIDCGFEYDHETGMVDISCGPFNIRYSNWDRGTSPILKNSVIMALRNIEESYGTIEPIKNEVTIVYNMIDLIEETFKTLLEDLVLKELPI